MLYTRFSRQKIFFWAAPSWGECRQKVAFFPQSLKE